MTLSNFLALTNFLCLSSNKMGGAASICDTPEFKKEAERTWKAVRLAAGQWLLEEIQTLSNGQVEVVQHEVRAAVNLSTGESYRPLCSTVVSRSVQNGKLLYMKDKNK
ncbi:MAG: hypothetical protein ACREBW_03135 [Candidatus Micrarchaeaceae archaeon]